METFLHSVTQEQAVWKVDRCPASRKWFTAEDLMLLNAEANYEFWILGFIVKNSF